MIIRKADRKVRFDEINKIYFDNITCKIIHSNHLRYRPGQRVDEAVRFGHVAAKGWEVIPLRHDKLQTESLSVEDLINNVILPDESEGRYTVFESPDGETAIFSQMRGEKVFTMSEEGEEKYYDSVTDFLESLPEGWVLAGQIDEADLEDEMEEEE
jgi:hypothetical protein